ncbi:MAG TPA: hypothetical protein VGK73_13055 [Polyangiaceae bacterium]
MSARGRSPSFRLLLAALAFPAVVSSCQVLAGIENRELGPCGEYCDVVMRACAGENSAYESREKCLGICALLEPGDEIEPQNTDTVQCRLREARRAETAISEQVPDHCRAAGPEGVGCADSPCEAYCTLYERACNQQCNSHSNCVDKCRALRDKGSFDAFADYEGDTLQCRLVHLSNATLDPAIHCGHAKLVAPDNFCVDGPEEEEEEHEEEERPAEPRCEDYCRVVGVACTDGAALYDDDATCLATCAAFTPGSFTDKNADSIGCRLYHGYNALCVPDPHCSHASPTGGGVCGTEALGGECAAYCRLAATFCATEFAGAFPDGNDACLEACAGFSGRDDRSYSVARGEQGGDTLACRTLHASRAAIDPERGPSLYCPAAFGASPCSE